MSEIDCFIILFGFSYFHIIFPNPITIVDIPGTGNVLQFDEAMDLLQDSQPYVFDEFNPKNSTKDSLSHFSYTQAVFSDVNPNRENLIYHHPTRYKWDDFDSNNNQGGGGNGGIYYFTTLKIHYWYMIYSTGYEYNPHINNRPNSRPREPSTISRRRPIKKSLYSFEEMNDNQLNEENRENPIAEIFLEEENVPDLIEREDTDFIQEHFGEENANDITPQNPNLGIILMIV